MGPIHFIPSENCFIAQHLTGFFAKSLFDVNIVLLRLTTFLFSMSTDMKLFTSLSVRLWDRPNGPVLGTKVGFVLLCRVMRLSLFSPRAR